MVGDLDSRFRGNDMVEDLDSRFRGNDMVEDLDFCFRGNDMVGDLDSRSHIPVSSTGQAGTGQASRE